MRKSRRFLRSLLALAFCLTALCSLSITAFAYADDTMAEETEAVEGAVPEAGGTAFTPDGNATILDEASSDQNKYFYTIQTENNNTFFLIIDKARSSGNVYLLSAIDENDLMEFVTTEETEQEDSGAIPEVFVPATEPEPETEEPPAEEPPVTDTESTNSNFMLLAVGVLASLILVGYYIVKIKNKDRSEDDEDETEGMEEPDETDDAAETEEIDDAVDADYEAYPDPKDYPDGGNA